MEKDDDDELIRLFLARGRKRKNGIGNIKEEGKHLWEWERTTTCNQRI